jgi:uncharacterized protein (TIGR00106 family)
MSVIMQFAMFPTDKGISVGNEVSRIIEMIRNSGVTYKLGSMSTTIETNTFDEALEILRKSYQILENASERIYSTVSFDVRKGETGRIDKKVQSIESKIGNVNK